MPPGSYGWGTNPPKAHFMGCHAGRNIGGTIGVSRRGDWLNCLNSENSTKPPFWPKIDPGFMAFNGLGGVLSQQGESMEAYGHEFCPPQCVNDCAFFKYGHFNGCGVSTGRGFYGYNSGTTNAVGPNPNCGTDYIKKDRNINMCSYLWCGDTTTTSTT